MPAWLWILLIIVLAIVVIANIVPMILLSASVLAMYWLAKKWSDTESIATKVLIIIAGIILVCIAISNIYALIGIAAGYALYLMWRKKDDEPETIKKDPFQNFEREWSELKNKC